MGQEESKGEKPTAEAVVGDVISTAAQTPAVITQQKAQTGRVNDVHPGRDTWRSENPATAEPPSTAQRAGPVCRDAVPERLAEAGINTPDPDTESSNPDQAASVSNAVSSSGVCQDDRDTSVEAEEVAVDVSAEVNDDRRPLTPEGGATCLHRADVVRDPDGAARDNAAGERDPVASPTGGRDSEQMASAGSDTASSGATVAESLRGEDRSDLSHVDDVYPADSVQRRPGSPVFADVDSIKRRMSGVVDSTPDGILGEELLLRASRQDGGQCLYLPDPDRVTSLSHAMDESCLWSPERGIDR